MRFEKCCSEDTGDANRETNEQLHVALVFFSSHFGLNGREADWEKASCFEELILCQAQCQGCMSVSTHLTLRNINYRGHFGMPTTGFLSLAGLTLGLDNSVMGAEHCRMF